MRIFGFVFLGKKTNKPKTFSCYGICRRRRGHGEVPEDEMVLASDGKKGIKFTELLAGLAALQRTEDAEAALDRLLKPAEDHRLPAKSWFWKQESESIVETSGLEERTRWRKGRGC